MSAGLHQRSPIAALAVAALLALAPAVARAAVSITPGQIALSGRGFWVTVQRDPFQMRFASAPGAAPALTELPGNLARASLLLPTLDPQLPGVEPAHSGQLYAPLAFLVGSASYGQYDGLVWGGDLAGGVQIGVWYSARAVIAARRAGSAVALTVSTDDPGRTLQVAIAPDGRGLVSVRVTPQPQRGVAIVSDSFASPPDEAFYGFGGRHDALDQRGQDLANFAEEENIPPPLGLSLPALSPATVLFPGGPDAAYYPQAQFISSEAYGFLLSQPQLSFFRLDCDRPDSWSVAAEASSLSYVVAPGRPRRAIAELTALTGRQPAPPLWGLGPELDRLVRNLGATDSSYAASVESDLANLARYHLPLRSYRIEGWGLPGAGNDGLDLITRIPFATQQRIVAELRARHIHALAYLRPFVTPGSAPDRERLTIRGPRGGTFYTSTTTGAQIALLDFTNPAAIRFWASVVDQTLNLGFDGFMTDYGEEVLAGMHFADGESGASLHNRYPILYMRATRAALDAYERAHRGRTVFFFNRAGFSGTPGSAAYEAANFPGDEATDWGQASGLQAQTPDMLSRAIGGAYGYGTDIGGYFDYTTPPTTKELFLRWAEWAALSPVFRLHGSGLHGTHTPWSYDQQTVRIYDRLSRLHERAAPLILRLWKQADRTGIPPTRPLWLEFAGDPRAAAQQQEWALGPDVLVAPVVTQGAVSRGVYFPAGCWRDPQSGMRVRGPAQRTVSAPLGVLPFFFRCGTRPFRTAGT